jgi:hypothetical protein
MGKTVGKKSGTTVPLTCSPKNTVSFGKSESDNFFDKRYLFKS